MPSTQSFRRRIKSVNNTKQITKAMEMIASIKMQKAVRTIGATRSYIQNAWNILKLLASKTLPENHPLLQPEEVGKTAIILITSDRGLCGSYNAEVIKKYIRFVQSQTSNGNEARNVKGQGVTESQTTNVVAETGLVTGNRQMETDVIAIGKVGAEFVRKSGIGNLVAEFKGFENEVTIENIIPISKMTTGEYLNGNYNKVVVIYSHFVSSLKQIPVTQQILPITDEHIDQPDFWESQDQKSEEIEYKFEPNAAQLFDNILKQILRSQIFGAVLEANASEHSARMVAMKSATDNAKSLIDELTLIYNSIRQDSITREIAEISGAAESMK